MVAACMGFACAPSCWLGWITFTRSAPVRPLQERGHRGPSARSPALTCLCALAPLRSRSARSALWRGAASLPSSKPSSKRRYGVVRGSRGTCTATNQQLVPVCIAGQLRALHLPCIPCLTMALWRTPYVRRRVMATFRAFLASQWPSGAPHMCGAG